jgi:hypothetical protein
MHMAGGGDARASCASPLGTPLVRYHSQASILAEWGPYTREDYFHCLLLLLLLPSTLPGDLVLFLLYC